MSFTSVDCLKVTPTEMTFKCPFCWKNKSDNIFSSPFFKNGGISNRTRTIHKHSNENEYENRIEVRSSHCDFFRGDFIIIISDKTIKQYPPSNIISFD